MTGRESSLKPIEIPKPVSCEVEVGEERFNWREFTIGPPPEGGVVSPGLMETGQTERLAERYREDPTLVTRQLRESYGVTVPYTFLHREGEHIYGNYTTPQGQDEFQDSDLLLTDERFNPPDGVKELWDFAAAKLHRKFTTDTEMACVRALTVRDKKFIVTVGPGLYSESFYSNGAEGVTLGLTSEEEQQLSNRMSGQELIDLTKMAQELEKKYGQGVTIRDVLLKKYQGLRPFGDHIHNNNIGVAGTVLTKDNQFIYVRRGKNVSVNLGINCTASGAAEFDKAALSKYGLQQFLGKEMDRETRDELGLRGGALIVGAMKERLRLEIGLDEGDYEITPVGFIRELARGGKPECMFLIQYKGSSEDIVRSIINNSNKERKEIDTQVYAQPMEEVGRLIRTPGADRLIHPQALVNLMLIDSSLKAV